MTRLAPAVAVLLCASLIGCNSSPLAVANRAEDVLTAVIQVASAETPAIPVSDQPAYTNFVNLAKTLDNQLSVCIAGVSGLTGQGAKFAACFTAFASGLFSPTELQQLRILNPATQNKIQLYATAVVTGLNVALAFFGSTVVSPPAIGTPPTSAQLKELRTQVGY
jgi:hypothetical protein